MVTHVDIGHLALVVFLVEVVEALQSGWAWEWGVSGSAARKATQEGEPSSSSTLASQSTLGQNHPVPQGDATRCVAQGTAPPTSHTPTRARRRTFAAPPPFAR